MIDEGTIKLLKDVASMAAQVAVDEAERRIGDKIDGATREFRDEIKAQRKEASDDLEKCKERHEQRGRFRLGAWIQSIGILAAVIMSALSLWKG